MGISLKWYADKWLVGCSHYESYYSTASFTLLVSVHMFSFLRQTLVFPMADSLSWGMILIGFIYTYKTPPKGMKKKKKKQEENEKDQNTAVPDNAFEAYNELLSKANNFISCYNESYTKSAHSAPSLRESTKMTFREWILHILMCTHMHTHTQHHDSDRRRRILGNYSHSGLYRFVLSQVWSAGLGRGRSSWRIKSCGSQLRVMAGQGNNLRPQIAHDSSCIVSFSKHEFLQLIRWDISLADSILCLAKHSQGPQHLTCLQILYVCLSHPNNNTSSVVNTHIKHLNLQGQFRCDSTLKPTLTRKLCILLNKLDVWWEMLKFS